VVVPLLSLTSSRIHARGDSSETSIRLSAHPPAYAWPEACIAYAQMRIRRFSPARRKSLLHGDNN